MWMMADATEMVFQRFTPGLLPGRAVVRIAGAEARHFLHNLLTADIEPLKEGQATYAALLTPQGKILFDVFVYDAGNAFLIDCARSQRDDFIKRLTFYKLRAVASIVAADDLAVGVSPEEPAAPLRYADPRYDVMGWRFFTAPGSLPDAEGYDDERILSGLADSDADLQSGQFFPHDANLDQLGAVSFKKGCYVGQEVVARTEHRGLAKSRMLHVTLEPPASLPNGTEIRSGPVLVGTLLSSSGGRWGLALIRLDRLDASTEPLMAGGVGVTVFQQPWSRYAVPKAEV